VLGASSALPAAPPTVAEIEQSLRDAPVARKSALLLALSVALGSVDTERAFDAASRAREAATSAHDELLADARISLLQRMRGDFAQAFTTAHVALERATDLGDDAARAELLLAYARCHWSLGDLPGAMAAHQQLIALAGQLGNRLLVGRGHLGLSVVYGELKDRAKAREEEELALRIAREIGDRELESDALNNLGNNYRNSGEHARARAAHEQALSIRQEIGNRRGVGDSHINLSEVARTARDFPTALDHARRALAIYEQIGLPRYVANAHLHSAAILRETGQLDEAVARLQTGFAIAEPLANPSLLLGYYREFAAIAAARGDWRVAYEAERKRAAAADTVLGEKARQQTAALNARYEADRRHQEIALLRGERARQESDLRLKDAELNASTNALERSNATRLALGLSLISLATALGAIVMIQRVRLRAERRVLEETRVAKDAAEEADRIKTRFLGIASHDIRGPLGNILNLTSEVRTGTRADTRTEHCDLIGSEAQRVLCLVEDLITTAALEAGKLEVRPAPMDLDAAAREVIESLRWQVNAKRQTIDYPPPAPGAGRINGDSARLHQVIANLLSNAIKFSPPGETISLLLARNATAVELSIRDRGAGIEPKDIPRLFAPFERLATHPTAGESSHGLGLSIAQEIVRRHGGTIRVESQPGEGATFVLSLPV
jgi:signal transduction histidine kinase